MNERFKALAEQARTHFPKTDSSGEFWVFDEQKFAELIVNDCASICEINGQSYKHSFTPAKAKLAESTSDHCAKMIKLHFGVEE